MYLMRQCVSRPFPPWPGERNIGCPSVQEDTPNFVSSLAEIATPLRRKRPRNHGEARSERPLCRITSCDLPDEAKFSAIGAEARRRDEHISDGTWPARSQLGRRLGI